MHKAVIPRFSLIILAFAFHVGAFGQDVDPKAKTRAEKEEHLKKFVAYKEAYSAEYKKIVLDSIQFTGRLIDRNLGSGCGEHPGAGIFVFKVAEADDKELLGDTIGVIAQCAIGLYDDKLIVGRRYRLKATPNRMKRWLDIKWHQYEHIDRYFLLRPDPIEVN